MCGSIENAIWVWNAEGRSYILNAGAQIAFLVWSGMHATLVAIGLDNAKG
jgi:hypothetical protein